MKTDTHENWFGRVALFVGVLCGFALLIHRTSEKQAEPARTTSPATATEQTSATPKQPVAATVSSDSPANERQLPTRPLDETKRSFTITELGGVYYHRQEGKFEGHVITVYGVVKNIGSLGLYKDVVFGARSEEGQPFYVVCFRGINEPPFEKLGPGSEAKIVGTLKGMVGSAIVMEQCEDVTVSDSPQPASDTGRRAAVDAMPISGTSLEFFLNPIAMASGQRPTAGTIYPLAFLRVVQKVEGGYLMCFESPMGDSETAELVFVKTTMELPENFHFMDMAHFGAFVGPYQYQAVSGFTRSVYEFDMFSDEENGWVLERLHQKPSTKGFIAR